MKVCCINSVVVKRAERPEEDADLPGCDLQNKKYVKRKKHLHGCAENKNNSSEFGRFLLTLTKLHAIVNRIIYLVSNCFIYLL